MSPAATHIIESVRKLQSERDALLDLLARIQSRGGVIMPADLADEIRARLN
jgi:NADH:ubiquinone oxidoreductase subunit E